MTHESQSPTATPSTDSFGLGRTPGQRGAEILAGIRAERYPSPETLALSRFTGRVVARIILTLEKSEAAINYVPARLNGFAELVKRHFHNPTGTIVEIAAGFSPRGVMLARELPDAQIIEIDLPDVVADKQRRLRKLDLPPNLRWLGADLGITPLHEVLDGETADIVTAEGLFAYFSHEEITGIASNVRASLKPEGVFIADVPNQQGLDEIREAARFFSRQAGNYAGVMSDEAQAIQTFTDAGYPQVEAVRLSTLTDVPSIPQPLIDMAFVMVAHNG